MVSKKEKPTCSPSTALFLLAAAFLAIAIVFSAMFLGPEKSDALPFLKKGMQSTCMSDNKGSLYKTRVSVVNKTMEGLSLTTYVFNKRPMRATYDFKASVVFNGEKKVVINVPMVDGGKVKYSIDVDTPTNILYRSWAKRSTSSAYEKKGVQQFSDVVNTTRNFPDAEFRFTAKNPIHGTFNVSALIPQWYLKPEEAISKCNEYPCEWKYKDFNWNKSSLWFITANDGDAVAQLDSKNYYKFVHPSLCISLLLMMFMLMLRVLFLKQSCDLGDHHCFDVRLVCRLRCCRSPYSLMRVEGKDDWMTP